MKAAMMNTSPSPPTSIELYSNDSCFGMISDSPQDMYPFPMVDGDQKLRFVYDDYVEGGALRSGNAPNLFSRQYFGLVAQYAAVGFIDGVLPNVIYPFLQNYLNIPGAQTTTAFLLVQMPWSFKVFYGIVSDCFPIRGYRRRPYILGGWIFALSMLLIMSFTPKSKPYFTNSKYRDVKPEDYTPEIIATINYTAATDGTRHIIPMMGCAFGYLLSDACADGLVVELAQRELLGFCFNGEEYGGDFDFSLSFPMLMLLVTIVLAPIVPVTWFFLHEEKNEIAMDFGRYIHTFWNVIQMRAVYQYIAYRFFSGTLASFTFLSKNPIMRNWVRVLPIQEKVGGLLSAGMYATSIYFAGNYGRSWDWRRTAVVTLVGYVALDAFVKMLTIWNYIRSPYFWLGITMLEQIPLGVNFIVGSFVIVELAAEGHEAAMYGLFTTVYNLTTPFSATITRNVDGMFNLTTERIQNDSYDVRSDMTTTVVIMWTANLCSLIFLKMLPRQKEQTHAMKQRGGSSYILGVATVSYLMIALFWTVITSVLSILPSTSCLAVAGGIGCTDRFVKP